MTDLRPDYAGEPNDAEPLAEINTTPLIDVMLVLFIMLIITVAPATHTVTVDMPSGSSATTGHQAAQVIEVDDGGQIVWDGQVLSGRRALETRLRAVAADGSQPELHLRPSRRAPYRSVAAVLAASQRLGVKRLGLVANDPFPP